MEARIEYDELKHWVLEGLYDDHRASLYPNGNAFDKAMSLHSIAASFEDVFERPIENLMLLVFLTILGCDCGVEKTDHWRNQIEGIIAKQNLTNLLAEITEEELNNFVVDLQAHKLSPSV